MTIRSAFAVVMLASAATAAEFPKTAAENIRQRVDKGYDVGISAAVITEEGTATFVYGNAEAGVPLKPDAMFEIGSITKAYNALILADMAAKGELGLDDTISQHLSARLPRKIASITMRQLASHTSGLPRLPQDLFIADENDPYAEYGSDELGLSLGSSQLMRAPGAGYEYSNFGAGVLGFILANKKGKSWEALAKERVLDPLGLKDTTVTLSEDQKRRLTPGHVGEKKVANWHFDALAGAGALLATATDVARFSAANAGMVDSPLLAAMKTMQQPVATASGMANTKVGLGWHITTTKSGGTIIWHNGGTGGYRSFSGFIAGGKRAVAVLTNTQNEVDRLGMHLLDPSLELPEVKDLPKVTVDAAKLKAYEGKYTLAPGMEFDVRVEDGQLTAQLSGQPRLPVYPESDTKFYYKVVEAKLEFELGEDGKAAKVTLYQNGATMPAARSGD